jgi:hypothetical protein
MYYHRPQVFHQTKRFFFKSSKTQDVNWLNLFKVAIDGAVATVD